jgi:glycosyltransferase involved in cell wall biosynthesis
MPTYNHEPFVREAMESVLGQTYSPFELLVGDDASRDGTPRIVEELASRNPERVRTVLASRNHGMARNLNALLELARGEYVALVSGDDLWRPEKLEAQVARMEGDAGIALCCTMVEVRSDDGSGAAARVFPTAGEIDVSRRDTIELTFDLGFCASTALVRRGAVPEHGFDERLALVPDWLFWIEALRSGRLSMVEQVLACYRLHSNNTSRVLNEEVWVEYVTTMLVVSIRYPELREAARRKSARLLSKLFRDSFLTRNDEELNSELARAAMRVAPISVVAGVAAKELLRRLLRR